MSGVDSRVVDGFAAGAGGQHRHSAALQHAAEGEDVAHVVVHHQHFLADQRVVGTVQPVEHLLLLRRQVGDDAMQEQRRFIQQALRRFHALHDDAAGQRVQAGVFLRR